jgi:hypothetical protein
MGNEGKSMNIRDWYFCASLRLSVKEIKDFLTLLAFLDGISDRPGVRAEAINQLNGLDAVRQLWAFPRVVALLRGASEEIALTENAGTYLSQLARILPEEVKGAFQQLFRRLPGGKSGDLARTVIHCAGKCAQLSARQPAATPYLDTETFAPEIIVLSVCVWLAEQGRADLGLIAEQGENDRTSPINRLVESALDLQCGRLAHAIATSFALYFPGVWPKEKLHAGLLAEFRYQPELEPDALWLAALIEFGPPKRDGDASGSRKVVKEMLRFGALHQLRRQNRRPAVARQRDLMSYLGLADTPAFAKTVGLILWHATLWDWLADRNPQTAACDLEPLWRPRLTGYRTLNVYDKADAYDDGEASDARTTPSPQGLPLWHDDLKLFSELLWNMDLDVVTGIHDRFAFPRPDQWMLFSPWLYATSGTHRGHKDPRPPYQRRYPNEQDWRVLLRLICASLVTTRILVHGREDPPSGSFDVFGAFTMHAADVLSIYRQPSKRDPEKDSPPVAEPLEGLASAAQRILTLVGCGVHSRVGPDRFLAIVNGPLDPGQEPRTRERYRALFDLSLPEVLVRWVQDAAEMGRDDRRTGRWQQYVPEVDNIFYPDGVQRRDRNPEIRLLYELMRRYLGYPVREPVQDAAIDWRNPPRTWNLKNRWNQAHRRFLIGTEPRLRELDNGPDDVASDNFNSRRLVWSILGVHAASQDTSFSPTELADRIDRLERVLHLISNKISEMDRFVRLRMIELLELRPVQMHPRLPGLIFSLVAEFGAALDLLTVREILEQSPPEAASWIDRDAVAVQILTRLLTEDTDYTQTTDDPDAWQALADRDRLVVAEDLLLLILRRESLRAGVSRELHQAVAELRTDLVRRRTDPDRQVLAADNVFDDSGVGYLDVARPLSLGTAALTAASRDRNSARTWLYVRNPDTFEKVPNLFSLSDDDRNRWMDSRWIGQENLRKSRVLALALPSTPDRDGGGVTMRWHIGLGEPIRQHFQLGERAPSHVPWSLVVCPIHWNDQEGLWRYDKYPSGQISPKHLQDLEGTQLQIQIALPDSAQGDPTFKLGAAILESACVPARYWQADSSGVCKPHDDAVWCTAVAEKDGILRPVFRSFVDLVLEQFPGGSQGRPVVLTLVEFDSSSTAEGGKLLLSGGLGQYYSVDAERFDPAELERLSELRERLSAEISSDIALRGLLISVCLNDEGNGLLLSSGSTGDPDSPDAVSRPFDDRNIRWRGLFSDNPYRVVERHGRQDWILKLDVDERVSGFGNTIKIVPAAGTSPPYRDQTASVLVQDWDEEGQRKATARAEFVKVEALNAADGDIDALLQRISRYQPGTRIRLRKKISGILGLGYQLCATDENLPVEVAAESLTMERIGSDGIRIDPKGRQAEIVWVGYRTYYRQQAPLIDPTQLPEQIAHTESCIGAIISVPERRRREEVGYCDIRWQMDEGYVGSHIHIENLSTLWVMPGTRIVGQRSGDTWSFRLESLTVRARALWRVEQIGALYDLTSGFVGQKANDRAGESHPFFPYKERGLVRRCCLVMEGQTTDSQDSRILTGECDPDAPRGMVQIEDVLVTPTQGRRSIRRSGVEIQDCPLVRPGESDVSCRAGGMGCLDPQLP